MSRKQDDRKEKLLKIIELLKFALYLDDKEMLHSTIESIIESLEDEINN
jgi:hypothetical protein